MGTNCAVSKAHDAARMISRRHNIGYGAALSMTGRILDDARRSVLRAADGKDWRALSHKDKARVCETVIRSLLDRRVVTGFLSGDRKSLV